MLLTIGHIKGSEKWVVKDENGVWLSQHDTEEEAIFEIQRLKDEEQQISLDLGV